MHAKGQGKPGIAQTINKTRHLRVICNRTNISGMFNFLLAWFGMHHAAWFCLVLYWKRVSFLLDYIVAWIGWFAGTSDSPTRRTIHAATSGFIWLGACWDFVS